MKPQWVLVPNQSLSNLSVLKRGTDELGFIHKPKDTRTDKNAWRCYLGIGIDAKFLGHRWTKNEAKALVEASI
jgi:hypothetical protein